MFIYIKTTNTMTISLLGVIKIDFIESSYNKALKFIFSAANPAKKLILDTHCAVHKFININALNILANDKYIREHNLFFNYIQDINEGAVWADQDFKSSNHFYNPVSKKGMYGRKSAMDLGIDYYNESLRLWKIKKFNESMFYLGAALHIIQDMTVPQHANIRLLDNHKQYENYIISTYKYVYEFQVETGTYLLKSIEDYVRFNSRVALKVHRKYKSVKDNKERFYLICRCGLPLAERTTAGAMVMFYNDINSIPS